MKLLNILIESENTYFILAMHSLIEDSLKTKVNVTQAAKSECSNLNQFDAFIFELMTGEEMLCYQELLEIPDNKPVYFYINSNESEPGCVTECARRAVYIYKNMSTDKISELLFDINQSFLQFKPDCTRCNYSYLTFEESKVLSCYLSGIEPDLISKKLDKSRKTIYSQLGAIRAKFRIKKDNDIFRLFTSTRFFSQSLLIKKGSALAFLESSKSTTINFE